MQLTLNYNATDKVAEVIGSGGSASTGASWEDLGTFDHIGQTDDPLDWPGNHVIYQHVQNMLYTQKNVEDMMYHTITIKGDIDEDNTPVTDVSVSPKTASISLAATETVQLTADVSPDNADQTVTWSASSAKATVDTSGLVTPAATGQVTITATTEDGGFTAKCVVTITA